MKTKTQVKYSATASDKVLIKLCHCCGKLTESAKEPERCASCHKAFLPTNYFYKVHAKTTEEFKELFLHIEELHEEDLIKGYNVIW